MNSIKRISSLVKDILTENAETRNSDMLLYLKVCQRIMPIVTEMPFPHVLMFYKTYNLPCFETVRRSRQRIQAENPELAGDEKVRRKRKEREAEFREFAREGTV